MSEDKRFIDMCAVCKQGVTKLDMVYKKGRVFHPQCFVNFGSSFPTPDAELNTLSAKTRIELVQMKNLKVRTDRGLLDKYNNKETKKARHRRTIKKVKTKKKLGRAKKSKTKRAKRAR